MTAHSPALIGEIPAVATVTVGVTEFFSSEETEFQLHARTEWEALRQSDLTVVASGTSTSPAGTVMLTDLPICVPLFLRVRQRGDGGIWSEWSGYYAIEIAGDWHFEFGATEITAPAIDTFPVPPIMLQPFGEAHTFMTLVSTEGSGREQRRSKGDATIRIFNLKYPALSLSDFNILWNFYRGRKGPLGRFNFVHPRTSETIVCTFEDTSMTREQFESTLYRTGLVLSEQL